MNSLKANVVAPNHSNKLKELRFESKYGLNCCNTNIVALFLKNIQSIVLSFFIFFLGLYFTLYIFIPAKSFTFFKRFLSIFNFVDVFNFNSLFMARKIKNDA